MGTTMSYIQLKNRGFSREELRAGLKVLADSGKRTAKDMEKQMEALTGKKPSLKERALLRLLMGVMKAETDERPQAAFRPDAGWLPFWQSWLCDGRTLSSRDLQQLSEVFQTEVLAFSVFDSDVMFVSYRDAAGRTLDYAKPNLEGYEEYDSELYQTGFPDFLLEFCLPDSRGKLEEIWEAEEVFADDRMWKLLELMGMDVIDSRAEHFPQGFEKICGE